MTRLTMTPALLAIALAIGACDKSSDEQQKANAAQAEADKKIAQAQTESATKVTSAQLEADKKIAAAEGDFGKRREEYRHKVQTDLVDLDKKIELLEAKSKAATGKAKNDVDFNLIDIRARRTGFTKDMTSVDTATALEWDGTKARVDKDWTDLKALVDKAS